MKVEAGVEVRGRTFSLPPARICQAVIAPGGEFFQSRGRRFLSSHMMLCLFPACRGVGVGGGHFSVWAELFVLERDECFHAMALTTVWKLGFSKHGIQFHLDLLKCCNTLSPQWDFFKPHCQPVLFFSPLKRRVFVRFHPLDRPYLKYVWCGQMQKTSSCLGFNHYPNLIWVQWAIHGY